MKPERNDFLIHAIFLTMTSLILFHCCKNVFIHIDKWMIGKNLTKLNYLKKKIFAVT